jgi:hypothetical protein
MMAEKPLALVRDKIRYLIQICKTDSITELYTSATALEIHY